MKTLLLSWRNVWRNKGRTLLTAGAIAFTSMILTFMIALQQSSYQTAIEATTRLFQGELQVQHRDYFADPRLYVTLSAPSAIKKKLLSHAEVATVTARLNAFALVSSEERTYGVQVFGIEPKTEGEVSIIPHSVREGRFLLPDDAYSAIVGKGLATNLRVSLGDELTLLGQGADGSMAAAVLEIVGIFESGSTELDRHVIEIPFQTAQDIFSLPGQAHAIVVRSSNISLLPDLKRKLNRNKDDTTALTFAELNPGIHEAIELDMASGWLFFFSLTLIVAFGVMNTFLMSLLERTREFGLLLSLGMTSGGLMMMVCVEICILILVGMVPGGIAGTLILAYFARYGLAIPGTGEMAQMWNLPERLYPALEPEFLLLGPGISFVTILIFVTPFTLRLRNIQPVEALRAV